MGSIRDRILDEWNDNPIVENTPLQRAKNLLEAARWKYEYELEKATNTGQEEK